MALITNPDDIIIGTKVRVKELSDPCANPKYLGHEGTVVDVNTNQLTCNDGTNPLFRVKFNIDQHDQEEYWASELIIIDENSKN